MTHFLTRLPVRLALLSAIALGAVGCSIAPPAQFYQLQQSAVDTESRNNNATVLLGPLKIADYLQRESMLQRQLDESLTLSDSARWAGSLQDDIGQLLLRQISTQLGSSRISLYPDRVGMQAQAQVVLSISRLDSGVEQPAVLEAQWRLLDAKGELRNSRVVRFEEAHDGTVADQVRAQSDVLAQLSQQLVRALHEQLLTSVKKDTGKTSQRARPQKPEGQQGETISIPVVEPVREQDVYRF